MKIKAGKDEFTMPPFGELLNVVWQRPDGIFIRMLSIPQKKMAECRKKQLRGIPVYVSIDDYGQGAIFPAPDADGELRIRYYPPAMEA